MWSVILVAVSFVAGGVLGVWFWLSGTRLRETWLGNKVWGPILFVAGVAMTILGGGITNHELTHPAVFALGLFLELLSAGWLAQFLPRRK